MSVDILISGESLGQKKSIKTTTLLDNRAGEKFIDQNFVWSQKIKTKELKYLIEVFNVDGTPNNWGTITKYTQLDLTINKQTWTHNLFVTGLGKQKIILGYPWFKQTNLDINWKKCKLAWQTKQDERKPLLKPTIENDIDPEDWKNHAVNLIEELDNEQIRNAVLLSYIEEVKSKVWINAKTRIAMELAIKENKKKTDLPVEKLVPEDLYEFLNIFNDNKANRFPESNIWDHKIDMKEGFKPKFFKNYNLTLEEQEELDKFLDEKLDKKYIWPSQSPQASPFFVVRKKNGRLNHVKIIGIWMIGQSNLMHDGATIMFKSDLETNGKPRSKQIKDYMNLPLCSLECVIFQQLSKLWWMKYSKRKSKTIW
jgi:hypothetical protein